MGHLDDHAAVVGVGAHQPPPNEDVHLSDHRLRQLIARDPPPGGTTLLIHGDQPQQPGNDLLPAPPADRTRIGQSRVGLTGQGTLHPTEPFIEWTRQLTAAADPLGELGEGERQQRQRFPTVGVGDQLGHQVLVDCDTGQPSRTFNHRPQRIAPQRPQRVGPGRQLRQVGVDQQLFQKLRPQRRDHLHPTRQHRAKQLREPGSLPGWRLGEQLLELIHHHQQPPRPGCQQQLIDQPRQATVIKPVPYVGHCPIQPKLLCRASQFSDQLGHRIGTGQDRGQRPPARFVGHRRPQPGPDQRRLATP